MMKNISRLALLATVFVFALTMAASGALAVEKMTVTGKVEQGKIVADDGKEYKVVDNAKGKELMKDHMGHKVEVTGKVTKKDGNETINISSIKHLSGG